MSLVTSVYLCSGVSVGNDTVDRSDVSSLSCVTPTSDFISIFEADTRNKKPLLKPSCKLF